MFYLYSIFVVITAIRRLGGFIKYRQQSEYGLQLAKEEAERANLAKSEFLSTVSHELRTPLTSIKGAIDMVQSGKFGTLDPRALPLTNIAAKNANKLVYLVNDLLDMDKLETGLLQLVVENNDLGQVLNEYILQIKPVADDKSVKIKLELEDANIVLPCDRRRLGQVVTNLLSNAIKFSPENSEIKVGVKKLDTFVRMEFADNGPGIAKVVQGRLFDRFSQGDQSDTRNHSGTGLGLAISKAIVNLHGGNIGVVSALGEGSTFYVDIPLVDIALEAKQSIRDISLKRSSTNRIILVEDDTDLSVVMQLVLEDAGFEVDLAENIQLARDLFSAENYLAAVIDINLPDGNGLNLLKELRSGTKNKDLPVIVASGSVSIRAGKSNTLALKNIDWLQKPYDQNSLLDLLNTYKESSKIHLSSILYVEDDVDLQLILREHIGDKAVVTPAVSLKQSIKLLSKHKYDLVILDSGLPDGDGLDLISTVKNKSGVDTPIIIFSGSETAEEIAKQVSETFLKSDFNNLNLVEAILSYLPSDK